MQLFDIKFVEVRMIKYYKEDCLKTLGRMGDGSVRLFLQDTPFGVTKNGWDIKPDLGRMWIEWLRVGMGDCAFVFFATQPFASELVYSMPNLFRYDVIWEKNSGSGHLNAKDMFLRCHESILVFYRKKPVYNPQMSFGHKRKVSLATHKIGSKKTENYGDFGLTDYDSTERFPRSVLYFPTDKQKLAIHSTQKPVDLIRYLIRTYSNEGDLVFDGYMGSGTTAIGCIEEGRSFEGAEMDSGIFESADLRIKGRLNDLRLFNLPPE